jgi:peroxiredoxin
MESLIALARILLAGVFAAAAAGKLRDRVGIRDAVVQFGVPAFAASTVARTLPLLELVVAAALIPSRTAFAAAAAATGLLALFTVGIGANLALGRSLRCHCFGHGSAAPIGAGTIARNLALMAVGCLVTWDSLDGGTTSAFALVGGMDAVTLLGFLNALLLGGGAFVVVQLIRQHGRLLIRLDALEGVAEPQPPEGIHVAGLSIGAGAPSFSLPDVHGKTVTLAALRAHVKPVLLVFTDPSCGPCTALLPEIGHWQRDHSHELAVAVITRGDVELARAEASEHGLVNVLLQRDREVSDGYRAYGAPVAVLVAPDGTVASAASPGADAIRRIVAETTGSVAIAAAGRANGFHQPRAGSPVGTQVDFRLPDLDGRVVAAEGLRGTRVFLVHWSPSCGFCDLIASDLARLSPLLRDRGVQLVLAAYGDPEANRQLAADHGLEATILLLGERRLPIFDSMGTPVAYLLDEEGRVAGSPRVGATEVPQLAGELAETDVAEGISVGDTLVKGDPAPTFALPDVRTGQRISLDSYRGREVLLVFSDPQCGSCDELAPRLAEIDRESRGKGLQLVVVSRGALEANRRKLAESGIEFPYLVQSRRWKVAKLFGTYTTPVAFLVDETGVISSNPVFGAAAILALAENSVHGRKAVAS